MLSKQYWHIVVSRVWHLVENLYLRFKKFGNFLMSINVFKVQKMELAAVTVGKSLVIENNF